MISRPIKNKLTVLTLAACCGCAAPNDGIGKGSSTQMPSANAPNGFTGATLCLNARSQPGTDVISHIEGILGAGAVESPSDAVYAPPRPHVLEVAEDALAGPHFAMLAIEPTDVNQDLVPITQGGDRSRTEIKIAPAKGGMHEAFKAREGDTFVYTWRFRISPSMKFSSSFTHIHQIKAHGGPYAEPPLITFTPLANGNMEVRHVGDQLKDAGTSARLGAMPLEGLMGQWLDVREEITFSNTQGRYQLAIQDQRGVTRLAIDKSGLQLWRTGADHMRPKWGIYRKHHPALNQHVADTVYFANLGITRGARPSSNCRP